MHNDKEAQQMPEYLVFLILGYIKELKQSVPDHILVKAVEGAILDNIDDIRNDADVFEQLEVPLEFDR